MGNLVFQATLGGQVNLVGPNTASTFNLNVPAVAGTLVTTGDTGTVTNTMLAGSIANAKLSNSSVTIGSTSISLGATSTTLAGLTSVAATTIGAASGSNLSIQSNGTTNATLDTSGNLGLGVVPSAWSSSYKVIQNESAAFWSSTSGSGLNLTSGYYFNGTNNIYINSDYALRYSQNGGGTGAHAWYTAASGTAGGTVSFTQAMTLDASGNLLVGTTNNSLVAGAGVKSSSDGTDGQFAVVGATSTNANATMRVYSTGAGAYRFYVDYGGTIHATSIVITAISDERLKENVRDLDTGISTVMALKPRRYDWKEGKGLNKKNAAGFIAQEFETVFPDSVGKSLAGEDGIEYKNINYEELIPTLTKAIQEQQTLIIQLQSDVEALKAPK